MEEKRNKWTLTTLLLGVCLFFHGVIFGVEIDRFESLTTDNGLSQNTVTSILCDSKGFLWFGTMYGLNRYDGYNFKIFQNSLSNPSLLTNNRIVSIWEDRKQFIWFETYDGYYHYYNPQNGEFSTLPKYLVNLEEKYSKITCFYQLSDDEIWLGSSNSGVYRLLFDAQTGSYQQEQFLSRGQFSISNNDIRFITSDKNNNVYIGAKNGLNLLKREDVEKGNFYFQHFFSDMNFTSAIAAPDELWFGTENSGLVHYDLKTKVFYVYNNGNSALKSNHIDLLKISAAGNVLIGSTCLYIVKPHSLSWLSVAVDGNRIDKIFEDYKGLLWVTTGKFGVQQIDQNTGSNRHFDLTPEKYKYLSDKERPYFFEDSNKNLWICVHGGGLALFQRNSETFRFFRNNPSDPKSISSNTVMCIAEDKTGTLWVGTSLQGGVNKIIFKNPAFRSVQTNIAYDDFMENIIRSVFEDRNGNIWIASKGGIIKILDSNVQPVDRQLKYPFPNIGGLVFNVYAMFQDSKGYVWLGSKGAGIAVSKTPVNSSSDYSNLSFYRYVNVENDSSSLCNNNIYSIGEDKQGQIWIGTYGGGLCFTTPGDYSSLKFQAIDSKNSNLSNDMIRNIRVDSKNNLWVATTFGLNLLPSYLLEKRQFTFETYFHDPADPASICYNDVVQIFEDSRHNYWFGTFGGGVDFLDHSKVKDRSFVHLTEFSGLSNDEVFGIVEDRMGHIWFSTENGLSRFDPTTQSFEIFNKSNGLGSSEFSENTGLITHRGKLIFGSSKGIEIIEPEKIVTPKTSLKVTFTNFQLFNKDANVCTPGSPLKKDIAYTDKINLKYNQSSFRFEFSALNYLDESKTQFAYFLEKFDENWNYVGTERKATYTNLKPGEYIFRVKAALWDGKWDSEESTIRIIISPPWWGSTIAYIVYLILFLVASLFVSRIVIRVNTFRNELKVEKAVNEVKLQFFTNVSHEIRTPLTLILGPIEDLLFDSKFPDEFKPTLGLMQKNGKRMLYLLNQLLDFRKVQNKKMILKVEKIDIVTFTQSIFDNFVPFSHHNGIVFKFNVVAHPEKVWADPHRIDSVIFNILSNAFKFTPRGEAVVVTIDENKKANEVLVKISNGGAGIKSKDIPLLFNRYSILSGENMSDNSTGIGLNLSNEIVKMHGGEIRVESEPGSGSIFTIVLKSGDEHLRNQSNVQFVEGAGEYSNSLLNDIIPDERANPVKAGNPSAKHENTILLVEDNLQILNYLSDMLDAEFSILTASNGAEGLEMATNNHPDLIISDVMMPVVDGIQMTRSLKENFDTCHIPVILLTAKSGIDDQILGIESGAEAYILKPFNMGLLKSILFNMLEQRKLILRKYRDHKEIAVSDLKITSRDHEFIDKLIKYIEANYMDENLSINTLVEFSCVSRTVFYNKVKSLTGLSPIELMRQIKLKIAAQMLLNGYNVNEAAINIGFNDTRYFSKQFKELFGETPSNYRKMNLPEG
ncbi:MAG TPA: two-component regulator propeller domain-containing protein [Prolixibacteraceae bacterium]|nr:two-component regulator propeller domain-containing protein [Prolixibacteraceae bacterium]